MKITLDFENKEVTVLTKCTVEELKQTLKSLKLDLVWWKINPQNYDNFTFPDYPVYPTYPIYFIYKVTSEYKLGKGYTINISSPSVITTSTPEGE